MSSPNSGVKSLPLQRREKSLPEAMSQAARHCLENPGDTTALSQLSDMLQDSHHPEHQRMGRHLNRLVKRPSPHGFGPSQVFVRDRVLPHITGRLQGSGWGFGPLHHQEGDYQVVDHPSEHRLSGEGQFALLHQGRGISTHRSVEGARRGIARHRVETQIARDRTAVMHSQWKRSPQDPDMEGEPTPLGVLAVRGEGTDRGVKVPHPPKQGVTLPPLRTRRVKSLLPHADNLASLYLEGDDSALHPLHDALQESPHPVHQWMASRLRRLLKQGRGREEIGPHVERMYYTLSNRSEESQQQGREETQTARDLSARGGTKKGTADTALGHLQGFSVGLGEPQYGESWQPTTRTTGARTPKPKLHRGYHPLHTERKSLPREAYEHAAEAARGGDEVALHQLHDMLSDSDQPHHQRMAGHLRRLMRGTRDPWSQRAGNLNRALDTIHHQLSSPHRVVYEHQGARVLHDPTASPTTGFTYPYMVQDHQGRTIYEGPDEENALDFAHSLQHEGHWGRMQRDRHPQQDQGSRRPLQEPKRAETHLQRPRRYGPFHEAVDSQPLPEQGQLPHTEKPLTGPPEGEQVNPTPKSPLATRRKKTLPCVKPSPFLHRVKSYTPQVVHRDGVFTVTHEPDGPQGGTHPFVVRFYGEDRDPLGRFSTLERARKRVNHLRTTFHPSAKRENLAPKRDYLEQEEKSLPPTRSSRIAQETRSPSHPPLSPSRGGSPVPAQTRGITRGACPSCGGKTIIRAGKSLRCGSPPCEWGESKAYDPQGGNPPQEEDEGHQDYVGRMFLSRYRQQGEEHVFIPRSATTRLGLGRANKPSPLPPSRGEKPSPNIPQLRHRYSKALSENHPKVPGTVVHRHQYDKDHEYQIVYNPNGGEVSIDDHKPYRLRHVVQLHPGRGTHTISTHNSIPEALQALCLETEGREAQEGQCEGKGYTPPPEVHATYRSTKTPPGRGIAQSPTTDRVTAVGISAGEMRADQESFRSQQMRGIRKADRSRGKVSRVKQGEKGYRPAAEVETTPKGSGVAYMTEGGRFCTSGIHAGEMRSNQRRWISDRRRGFLENYPETGPLHTGDKEDYPLPDSPTEMTQGPFGAKPPPPRVSTSHLSGRGIRGYERKAMRDHENFRPGQVVHQQGNHRIVYDPRIPPRMPDPNSHLHQDLHHGPFHVYHDREDGPYHHSSHPHLEGALQAMSNHREIHEGWDSRDEVAHARERLYERGHGEVRHTKRSDEEHPIEGTPPLGTGMLQGSYPVTRPHPHTLEPVPVPFHLTPREGKGPSPRRKLREPEWWEEDTRRKALNDQSRSLHETALGIIHHYLHEGDSLQHPGDHLIHGQVADVLEEGDFAEPHEVQYIRDNGIRSHGVVSQLLNNIHARLTGRDPQQPYEVERRGKYSIEHHPLNMETGPARQDAHYRLYQNGILDTLHPTLERARAEIHKWRRRGGKRKQGESTPDLHQQEKPGLHHAGYSPETPHRKALPSKQKGNLNWIPTGGHGHGEGQSAYTPYGIYSMWNEGYMGDHPHLYYTATNPENPLQRDMRILLAHHENTDLLKQVAENHHNPPGEEQYMTPAGPGSGTPPDRKALSANSTCDGEALIPPARQGLRRRKRKALPSPGGGPKSPQESRRTPDPSQPRVVHQTRMHRLIHTGEGESPYHVQYRFYNTWGTWSTHPTFQEARDVFSDLSQHGRYWQTRGKVEDRMDNSDPLQLGNTEKPQGLRGKSFQEPLHREGNFTISHRPDLDWQYPFAIHGPTANGPNELIHTTPSLADAQIFLGDFIQTGEYMRYSHEGGNKKKRGEDKVSHRVYPQTTPHSEKPQLPPRRRESKVSRGMKGLVLPCISRSSFKSFTGQTQDSSGRTICFQQGRRVDCPDNSQQETQRGETTDHSQELPPQEPNQSLSPEREEVLTQGAWTKVKQIVSAITSAPGAAIPTPVKELVKRVKAKALSLLEKRYGKRGAKLISLAAIYSAPVPVPGTQPAAIILSLVAAECVRAYQGITGGRGQKAYDPHFAMSVSVVGNVGPYRITHMPSSKPETRPGGVFFLSRGNDMPFSVHTTIQGARDHGEQLQDYLRSVRQDQRQARRGRRGGNMRGEEPNVPQHLTPEKFRLISQHRKNPVPPGSGSTRGRREIQRKSLPTPGENTPFQHARVKPSPFEDQPEPEAPSLPQKEDGDQFHYDDATGTLSVSPPKEGRRTPTSPGTPLVPPKIEELPPGRESPSQQGTFDPEQDLEISEEDHPEPVLEGDGPGEEQFHYDPVSERLSTSHPLNLDEEKLKRDLPSPTMVSSPLTSPKHEGPLTRETPAPNQEGERPEPLLPTRVPEIAYGRRDVQQAMETFFPGKHLGIFHDIFGPEEGDRVILEGRTSRLMNIGVMGEGYQASHSIREDWEGHKAYTLETMYVEPEYQGRGIGTRYFSHLVENLSQHDFRKFNLYAARSKLQNGYYTWALLGCDAEIPPDLARTLPRGLQGAVRLSDLMKTREGQAWWKRYGEALHMAFDMSPDSPSRKQLQRYLDRRAKRTSGR